MSQLPSELRLISPYSALECKKQIASRNEDKTYLAFRGQQRIVTTTLNDDNNGYVFEIRRGTKSKLEFDAGMWSVRIKGTISERRGKTLVVAYVETSKVHVFVMVLLFVVLAPMIYFIFQNLFITEMVLFNVLFGVVFAAFVAATFWFYDHEKRLLLRILRDCTGETAEEISPEQAALYGIG